MNNIKCFISTLLLMLLATAFFATTVDVYASTYAVTVPGPDECEPTNTDIVPFFDLDIDRPGDPPRPPGK